MCWEVWGIHTLYYRISFQGMKNHSAAAVISVIFCFT